MNNKQKSFLIINGIIGYAFLMLGIIYHNGYEKITFLFIGIVLLVIRDTLFVNSMNQEKRVKK